MHDHSCFRLLARPPSALERHVREAARQHGAQCGGGRCGAGRRFALVEPFLVSVCSLCPHRMAHSVVESCPPLHMPAACAGPLANVITPTRTHSRLSQEIKKLMQTTHTISSTASETAITNA